MHNQTEFREQIQMDKKEELVNAVLKSATSGQESDDSPEDSAVRRPRRKASPSGQADLPRERLTCAQAFELAKQFNAEVTEIGHICNQHNIRICKCQLGCFA